MKRMIVASKSIRAMSYRDVLEELKRCILHHDKKRMRELSLSQYYDKAITELRKSMGICASDLIDDVYDIIQSSGMWYVLDVNTNTVVAGPCKNKDDALAYFDTERSSMNSTSRATMQHEKYLDWFDKYAARLPGKIDVDGYTGTRMYNVLKQFVDNFHKSHPEADLEIVSKIDGDSYIYYVI